MPNRPLILCYHAVSTAWDSQLAIPADVVRAQLAAVRRLGFVGLTFSEAESRRMEGTLPPKAVVVTFDDGYASTLRAKPILDELGYPASVFVVTQFVESGEPLAWSGLEAPIPNAPEELRPLGWTQLEELVADGWEVGSHTVTHPLLTAAADDVLTNELSSSRTAIAGRLGACSALAYPYGVADRRVADAARRAGYSAACTLRFVHTEDEPFRRPRIGLSAADVGPRLRIQLSPAARTFRRSRLAKALRRLPRRRAWLPEGAP